MMRFMNCGQRKKYIPGCDPGTMLRNGRYALFEMCLDLSIWTDGVICDYNYAFDPNVHLKRFFGDNISGDYIFLIDEAHNLVERGREMYSADIYRGNIVTLRRKVRRLFPKLARTLDKANRQMQELEDNLGENGSEYQVLATPGSSAPYISYNIRTAGGDS